MSSKTRAPKGGMIGKNGEHYEGGQFLPSNTTTEKGAYNSNRKKAGKLRKVQVAPYIWVFPPSVNHRPIYRLAGTSFTVVRDTTGGIDKDNPKLVASTETSYYREDPEYTDKLVAAFNKGYRWEVFDKDWNCVGIE